MAGAGHGGVEFLDLPTPVSGGPGLGGSDRGDDTDAAAPLAPRRRWPLIVLAVAVTAGVLTAARVVGAPPAPPPPAVADPPVFGAQVDLPPGFGVAVDLVTAPAGDADVVWALGEHGRVARIAAGAVTTVSAGAGYDALTVRPDGRSVFVATGRLAPTVVSLDPLTLEPTGHVRVPGPVSALASGVGTVWAAAGGAVYGWTSDLTRELRVLPVPATVTAVRALAVVGPRLQARVVTTAGTVGLLRLEPPGGAAQVSVAFSGPVSVVPGEPALIAHVSLRDTVEVVLDPSVPGGSLSRPLPRDAAIWPAGDVGTASWLVSTSTSPSIDCFDVTGQLVGRMTVGNTGRPVVGPVLTTSRAVYAVTAGGALARGGHASCGVAPRASTGGRRGD